MWGRMFGQQINNRDESGSDPHSKGQIAGFQLGGDLLHAEDLTFSGHRDSAGLFLAYGDAIANITGLVTNAAATGNEYQHTGSIKLDSWSAGGYWTHYGSEGGYVDLLAQGTHYSGLAKSTRTQLNLHGTGALASLEGGYPMKLGSTFELEPQAQLVWQLVHMNPGHDEFGTVDLGQTSGVTGRLGVRGKWDIETMSGQVWQPFVRVDYWNDFGGRAETVYSGIDKVSVITRARYMDTDVGFMHWSKGSVTATMDMGYQFSVGGSGGGQRQGFHGNLAVRYQF
jgi:outer membrane autotransporter protein